MKKSISNKFNEAHGKDMVIYEWITPSGINPYSIADKIETLLPSLKLLKKANEQNGFVLTSRHNDGSLYVAVCLHQFECLDNSCSNGEGDTKILIAPTLTPLQVQQMRLAIGEHLTKKVEGDNNT